MAAGHSEVRRVPVHLPLEPGVRKFILKLKPPGSILGTVDKSKLRPGLWVALSHPRYDTVSQEVKVDEEGRFRFDGVESGATSLRLFNMAPTFKSWDSHQSIAPTVEGQLSWHTPNRDELLKHIGERLPVEVHGNQTSIVHFGPPSPGMVWVRGVFEDERVQEGRSTLIFRRAGDQNWTQSTWIQENGAFEVLLPKAMSCDVYWSRGLHGTYCPPWRVQVSEITDQPVVWGAPPGVLRVLTFDTHGKELWLADDIWFCKGLQLYSRGPWTRTTPADRTVRGEITFRDLGPGNYLLVGPSNEYLPEEDRNHRSGRSTALWDLVKPVEVVIGDKPVEVRVQLAHAAPTPLKGTIHNPSGSLRASSSRKFFVRAWTDDRREHFLGSVEINHKGQFSFTSLPAGELFLTIVGFPMDPEFESVPVSTGLDRDWEKEFVLVVP